MSKPPVVEANNFHTLLYSVQCCSESNQVPAASQLVVVVTYKVVELKDKQGELVTRKENFTPFQSQNLRDTKA